MRSLRIGTRGSTLALAQTHEFVEALKLHSPLLAKNIIIVPITTTGDAITTRSLTDIGGKSLFTKEIEKALLRNDIDVAIHSMKDVTTDVPSALIFPTLLKREDPRDALITHNNVPLENLPPGTLFGTSSLRRRVYILHSYPSLAVTLLRGNVTTRLAKIESGEMGATLLAAAGLKRLGLLEKASKILPPEEFLPAVGQGAIGVQCRKKDTSLLEILSPLNHIPTFQAVTMERAFLQTLQGSCRTPIAGYAYLQEKNLIFKGMISDPLGKSIHFVSHTGPADKAAILGHEAAELLREKQCAVPS